MKKTATKKGKATRRPSPAKRKKSVSMLTRRTTALATLPEAQIANQAPTLRKCRLMECALVVEKDMTWEEGIQAVQTLISIRDAAFWWIGDMLAHLEGKFRDRFNQLFQPPAMPAYAVESCRNALWVCQRVPILHRNRHTPISVFQAVAKLETGRQKEVLDRVQAESLTRNEVRDMISKRRERDQGETAHNSGPVIALEAIGNFGKEMDRALQALPIDKWTPEALSTVQIAFDSAVKQARIAYGWQRQEA